MKKSKIILFALLLLGINLPAQNISGSWQRNSSIVGSGSGETYKFFANGKFEFVVSQYLYLNTIISFNGTYEIKNNQICFTIESRKEIAGYVIEQGNPGFEDNWVVTGGDIKEVKQDPITYCFDYSLTKKESQNILKIGNGTYYKLKKGDE